MLVSSGGACKQALESACFFGVFLRFGLPAQPAGFVFTNYSQFFPYPLIRFCPFLAEYLFSIDS